MSINIYLVVLYVCLVRDQDGSLLQRQARHILPSGQRGGLESEERLQAAAAWPRVQLVHRCWHSATKNTGCFHLLCGNKCNFFWFFSVSGVNRAVDLCAAPGSWSQVLSRKLRSPLVSFIVTLIIGIGNSCIIIMFFLPHSEGRRRKVRRVMRVRRWRLWQWTCRPWLLFQGSLRSRETLPRWVHVIHT